VTSTDPSGSPGVSPGAPPQASARPGTTRFDPVEPEPAYAGSVFSDRVELARRYVHALATDGVVRGLIGPREPTRLWSRHVLNSASVARLIGASAAVVDIGSGAGLPGIPLAIARPDVSVTMVEPLERRVRFLVEIVDALQLANCQVIRGRAEDVITEAGGADVVTSRAVAPLHRLVGWSAPLIRDGGLLLAMKGSSAGEELDRDRAAVTAAGLTGAEVLQLEDASGETTFVVRARRQARIPRSAVKSPRHRR